MRKEYFSVMCVLVGVFFLCAPLAAQVWEQSTSQDFLENTLERVKVAGDRVQLSPTGEMLPHTSFSSCVKTFLSPDNNLAMIVSDGTYYYQGIYFSPTVAVYGTGYNGTNLGELYGSFDCPTRTSGAAYVPRDNTIYFIERTWGGGGTLTFSKAEADGPFTVPVVMWMPTGGPARCNLISASREHLLLCYQDTIYFVDTDAWAVVETVTLDQIPGAVSENYAASFAFDGTNFYFNHQACWTCRDFEVYDRTGTLIDQYTSAYYVGGLYYDWMLSEYIAADGYGETVCGTSFGPGGGDDSYPISRDFFLQGTMTSIDIAPSPFGTWGVLTYDAEFDPGTDITVDVLDIDGQVILADVASGTHLGMAGVIEYPIRLRANMQTTDDDYSPRFYRWQVTWSTNPPTVTPVPSATVPVTTTFGPTPTSTPTPDGVPALGSGGFLLLLILFGALLGFHRRR